jgi:hypothetical protein
VLTREELAARAAEPDDAPRLDDEEPVVAPGDPPDSDPADGGRTR